MKERIFDGALRVIRSKGLKFTMDELANELGMSKKTIYKVFRDKKEMLYQLIDYVFDQIKKGEEQILADEKLSEVEKMKAMLAVLPDEFNGMDLSLIYLFAKKYPGHYAKVVERLETGWEMTWKVMDEGIAKGIFRKVDHKVFKLMFEAALERLLSADDLEREGMDYVQTLDAIVEILVDGIRSEDCVTE